VTDRIPISIFRVSVLTRSIAPSILVTALCGFAISHWILLRVHVFPSSSGDLRNSNSLPDYNEQELSYHKQIARKLRTQYVEGIYRPKYYTVTLKSKLRVT